MLEVAKPLANCEYLTTSIVNYFATANAAEVLAMLLAMWLVLR
jgi:hypothetical protein